jgi:hypothetical protein
MTPPPAPTRAVVASLVLIVLASGCATIDDLSSETFRQPGLPEQELRSGTVAALPMVANGASRSYLDSGRRVFAEALAQQWADRDVLLPDEAFDRIRTSGAEPVWVTVAAQYRSNVVPEEAPLKQLASSAGARFLLLTELESVEMAEGATHVKLTGRLWDADNGRIVWEATGRGRGYVFLFFPWAPSSFEKTMGVASRGLLRQFP